MMEYTTPISYGSTVVNVGGIAKNGEIICGGAANSVQHAKIKNDPENDWPEPGAAKFLWSGKTQDGKSVNAELEGNLGDRLDKVDVLANIPGILKSLVGGVVGTKPFIYQFRSQYAPMEKLELKIKIENEEQMEVGTLFSEAVFIS
ncbi:MAG: hypothetical protein L6R41_004237 [Letrouitia leprolyta]|nr:MAG: hypothetical protein L6R41_004237 [Letrouitia leprolyta]